MAKEIERKFLVDAARLELPEGGRDIRQGYLLVSETVSARVRVLDGEAFLTIKGGTGEVRDEYEYPIPLVDARELLDRYCRGTIVEKTRYRIPFDDRCWEVDVFRGDNEGLILAEVEFEQAGAKIRLPPWIDAEVTDDSRYANAALSQHPYASWS